MGWCVWRSPEYLPKELVFNINYLGADQASFTLNFSKGASQVIGQYYQMIRLGKHGYRCIMMNLTRTADYLAASLEKLGFIVMSKSKGKGLPLVAFRLDPAKDLHYDEFAVAHQLRERSWVVPAYTMAPHSENLKLMRVVVREDFSRSRCDSLVADIRMAVDSLNAMDAKRIELEQLYVFFSLYHSWRFVVFDRVGRILIQKLGGSRNTPLTHGNQHIIIQNIKTKSILSKAKQEKYDHISI